MWLIKILLTGGDAGMKYPEAVSAFEISFFDLFQEVYSKNAVFEQCGDGTYAE